MKEILPGIVHWTGVHPQIGQEVSSYWLPRAGVLIDPIAPPEPLPERPHCALLTNPHHLRDAETLCDRVMAPLPGLFELAGCNAITTGYRDGDILPGGIVAAAVGHPWPNEFALYFPATRALAVADGLFRDDHGELASAEPGLADAYAGLLRRWDFDHLLLAHGEPLIGDANAALRALVAQASENRRLNTSSV